MDEFIILKIENALYRLPKSVLTSYSEFFRDMFSSDFSTMVKEDNKEGSLDSTPIVFEQVLQKDFDRLLSLIIDGSRLNTSEINTWYDTDWIPVLNLADKWQMPKVKRLALVTLKRVAVPHIKITIGKKFEDKSLIQSGLVDLCTRAEPITESEAKEIGFEAAMKCAAIREKLWIKYFMLEKEGKQRLPRSQARGFAKVAQLYAPDYVTEAFSTTGSLRVV
ncbi:hypothetical protein Clacol_009474 [Clathrus columnatus]|uniref:BTB domain-containing protein n=1 Tax=Clathrus columnatus TaxID=1419009 RepID=A0AAV5ANY1_9AGAM|nr:hypothetical protein Clacol_009474 [Clathrus columnatus]